ncbi:thiamine-monophosphate kinase [Kineococcus radiotolerans]|uniref:Thiamine-monophosphate kinase n=1 Tax=Kineococcus radiotolerans TaxID=131568 RepID=A0A7W4TJ88_KINRA|nr:thiamine-phosphate kinase [Kineococcus radiotolerans]MBB2899947.1 thiamine-monophosphate kinase [Kineococcus radiotolerans]
MRVEELDETALLARVLPLMPTRALLGPGDDAALVAAPDGRVVATTDVLVELRDFRRDWSTGADVGWKAVAQNVADVAAMGATCTGLLLALGMPGDLEVAWVEDFARGVAQACAEFGAVVVGGDLSAASEIVVAVTALGDLAGAPPVLRSGARAGHVVAVAGALGRSGAGLDLLQRGVLDGPADLLGAHRRPVPPVAAGPRARRAGASALMDVSDGLLRDAGRIAAASGVTLDLSTTSALGGWIADLLPAVGGRATELVLTGGEDHALLGCFPPDAGLPAPFAAVGVVRPAGPHPVLVDGRAWAGAGTGWDHFAR